MPLALLGLGLSILPSMAAPPEPPRIRWATSWDEAAAEAERRNVPIMVTLHMDG
jgi:hypothetical protein